MALVEHGRRQIVRPTRSGTLQPCGAPSAMQRLFDLLRRASGIDFRAYTPTTIERRVGRRMALYGMVRLDDYVRLLEESDTELAAIHRDLLIGVTSFFRDGEPFSALRTIAFPRIAENRDSACPIRCWDAGCATGEEAYSLAIELYEYLDTCDRSFKVQIFATDVDEQALTRARRGSYPASIEMEVSPERLARFFVRCRGGYEISTAIRQLVIFAPHDMTEDPPYSRLDLISCRNVLIYLQPALQRKVLHSFHFALRAERFLLLGNSETVATSHDLFSLLNGHARIYERRAGSSLMFFDDPPMVGKLAPQRSIEGEPPGTDVGAYAKSSLSEEPPPTETIACINEDLHSTNEELESINEQLRRSQDELQNANEELVTLNEELHKKMEELAASHDDLGALLELLEASFVVVGRDLTIRRFSAAAGRRFHLTSSDVGCPVRCLPFGRETRSIERLVTDVIEKGDHRQRRVRLANGASGVMRVRAYGTTTNVGRGAIIEFVTANASAAERAATATRADSSEKEGSA